MAESNFKPAQQIDDLIPETRERLARVRMLIMDIDGVLTDGLIRLDEHGTESKVFSTRDGFALVWIKKYGLGTGAISGRISHATELRCKALHFDEIHLGKVHKLPVFEDIVARRAIALDEFAYIGDDILDLPVMQRVGFAAAPADAHSEVLRRVHLVLDYPGGAGAVRQFLDLWLQATGQYETALEDILHGNF